MDNNLIRDILYRRNQAGLIAISHVLSQEHRNVVYNRLSLSGGKNPDEIAYLYLGNDKFMFLAEKVPKKDAEILNRLLGTLPNFMFTFTSGLREFLDGPLLSEVEKPSSDFLIEVLIQLSFAYQEMGNIGGDMSRVKILYRDRDLSYTYSGYKITPSFLVIVPTLSAGDLSTLVKDYKYIGTPIDNLLDLVSRNADVKSVFDRIVKTDTKPMPILESPKYILAKIYQQNPDTILTEIGNCVSGIHIRDYPSALYYEKVLSEFPKNPSIDSVLSRLSIIPVENNALTEYINRPIIGVRLAALDYKYIDDLLPISTDPDVMKTIGNGEIWGREKLISKIGGNNWVILDDDIVVGYAGLHWMVNRINALQIRIFIGTQYRGKHIGTRAVKKLMEMQYVTVPFRILGVVRTDNIASSRMLQKAGMYLADGINIKGVSHNIYIIRNEKEYNNTFIIPYDAGFQYEKLRIQLSQHGLKEAVIGCPNPKFNWGSDVYCEMNSVLDGSDFVTDFQRLEHAITKYFPNIPKREVSHRTMRVYIVASILNGKFKVHVWNKAEFFRTEDSPYNIQNINIFLDTEMAKQLRDILTAVSSLLYKSARVSKKSRFGFQIYTVDLAVLPDDMFSNLSNSLSLKKVSVYNNYQYGTAGLKFSNYFFHWLNESVIIPFLDSRALGVRAVYQNNVHTFGDYDTDYEAAKRELPDLIDYPYLNLFTRDRQIKEYFNMLKNYTYQVSGDAYSLHNVKVQPTYMGKYIRIISTKSEVTTIGSISDYFSEDIRVHCKFLNNMPIYKYYNQNVDSLIDTLKSQGLPANLYELRELLWKQRQCTTFKPKIIKYIIDMFKARKVLDISAGWGDRLVGAMASDIDFYHGFDPNLKLSNKYIEIINFFKPQAVNTNIICTVEPIPFEQAELQPSFYDLVMSSPPYFTMEIYDETSEEQSTSNSPTEEHWYHNYLKVWVKKCSIALRKNGILALNINQERNRNYVEWLLRDTPSFGFIYLGVIGYSNEDGKNPQPIFIWRKL